MVFSYELAGHLSSSLARLGFSEGEISRHSLAVKQRYVCGRLVPTGRLW